MSALLTLHPLEERHHPGRIHRGGVEHAHAVAVGFQLGLSAVTRIAQRPCALDAEGHHRAHVTAQGGDQNGGAGLAQDRLGRVAVHDVLDLVGQDSGQLLGASRPIEQSPEHTIDPPGVASALTTGRFTTVTRIG